MSQNQSPSPVPSQNYPTSLHNALMATIQQPMLSPLPRLFSLADVHAATQAAQQQEMAQRLHGQGLGMEWSQTPLSQVPFGHAGFNAFNSQPGIFNAQPGVQLTPGHLSPTFMGVGPPTSSKAYTKAAKAKASMPSAAGPPPWTARRRSTSTHPLRLMRVPFGHAGFNVFNSQPGIFNAQPGVQLPPGQLSPTFVMGVAPPPTSKAPKKASKAKGAKASRPSAAVPPAMDGPEALDVDPSPEAAAGGDKTRSRDSNVDGKEAIKMVKLYIVGQHVRSKRNSSKTNGGIHMTGAALNQWMEENKPLYGLAARKVDTINNKVAALITVMTKVRNHERRTGFNAPSVWHLDEDELAENFTRLKVPGCFTQEVYETLHDFSENKPKMNPRNHTGLRRKSSSKASPAMGLMAAALGDLTDSIKSHCSSDDADRKEAFAQIGNLTEAVSKLAQAADDEEERKLKIHESHQRMLLRKLEAYQKMFDVNNATQEELDAVTAEVKELMNRPL
ncbi:hypothetical protein VOLCADRAFT_100457 [Volvox carteri f. nagariensis]|uniref:Uncharacterized protein n=1 Tax=Volvox carteri f. nagariensis TaxID=3068 RepID=D8UK91_VOLCA|nr:uncharacterized protein VOLCADRAFT_100457 [Volvox carteri f. nagariensis]EFJ39872.1 hypothetical protein VOLCADRAFT_100457 [Volvox carteri f. nagariensis]|eukprot:XP_002959078.1 hypothetical protein VOLCADRAFT_100457 [Volvox carteri f. nagariensis]